MNGEYDTDVYTFLMDPVVLEENLKERTLHLDKGKPVSNWRDASIIYYTKAEYDASGNLITDTSISNHSASTLIQHQENAIKLQKDEYINKTQFAIMNPYARVHLSGGVDSSLQNRLIDSSKTDTWYEQVYGEKWSKNPTTDRIIQWSKLDFNARTPYLFQDFVFCKHWNKIPNNRLITLRRYTNPVLDNLNIPAYGTNTKEDDNIMFPPLCTMVTYFGEDTGNNLKNILKFSTGVPWGETKAEVWELTSGTQPSTNEAYAGAFGALGLGFGGALATISTAIGVLGGGSVGDGLTEANGLPPDPYKDGPYTNRVQGVVNRIDAVKKRDPGINFEMSGLKIKFDYVARPIGGINSKAVMLDILANALVMGSPTAIFFGGAHRSRIAGRRFPAGNDEALRKLYQGKLFGQNGAINAYANKITNFVNGCGGVIGLLSSLYEAAKGLLGDLIGSITGETPKSFTTNNKEAKEMKEGLKSALTEKARSGMPVSYVSGMRSILTGEPVGDWHLTIGNPLNPIVMIGNLICTNIEIEIDEDAGLGPDDFPLGWSVTITLDHGMKRDRDALESMFNFGNGRIYELPDKFQSSGDYETSVDKTTGTPAVSKKVGEKPINVKRSEKGTYYANPLMGKPSKNGRSLVTGHIFGKDGADKLVSRMPAVYVDEFVTNKANK